jgi:hypothetical protein
MFDRATALLFDERCKQISGFCLSLANDKNRPDIIWILENGDIPAYLLFKEQLAVLEVCKVYDKAVQDKTGLQKSGRALMQEA